MRFCMEDAEKVGVEKRNTYQFSTYTCRYPEKEEILCDPVGLD